ncbi:MAG: NAD(P)H-dependent glycerol-3-phosphate dehydrogenase [Bacteroidetes bacterium]|nr:NAD(P)H-dependent glycerol-3-phosphate dehydrogenase [Bacteroidota bacterium]MCY4204151.1 NAD(P)H-dependent glycerol-3-phosphate dehydrogenase [Bacteroidota bacterium]
MPRAISVFGAGSWGTALSVSLSLGGHEVTLWARRRDIAHGILETRRNPEYLPSVPIPLSVSVTADIVSAARHANLWVVATPSHAVRDLARDLAEHCNELKTVISVAKGIERQTELTTTGVLEDVLTPSVSKGNLVALYGPSHAEEVAAGKPTTLVAASSDMGQAEMVQEIFMTNRLRIYVNSDVRGVEIGGSVKNIMAIASGISDGVGYGDNARAALITRGIAEIQRLGSALGANPSTFTGLTGLGDLVVTCTSQHSRNRHLGEMIGRGATLSEVTASMSMVAEGVKTTEAVYSIAQRLGIEMPITEAVYGILFDGQRPDDIVQQLMTRSAKQEEWLRE